LVMAVQQGIELDWRLREAEAMDLYPCAIDDIGGQIKSDLGQVHYTNKTLTLPDMLAIDRPHLVPVPQPALPRQVEIYPNLKDERITAIGAGAGALFPVSYLVHRGADPENITLIDPKGRTGGIWAEPWAQSGGFNNPKALDFLGQRLDLEDRTGRKMFDHLRRIAANYLWDANIVQGSVIDLHRKPGSGQPWEVKTDGGRVYEADSVILASGAAHPRPINGSRFVSNLDIIAGRVSPNELIVERFQRELTDEELRSGRPIILMGLGNSTAAMLNQIHRYEDRTGTELDYWVLTDHPSLAIQYPNHSVARRKPLFRQPAQGYLTGYSGDLPRDRDAYYRTQLADRIVPEVRGVWYNEETRQLEIHDRFGVLYGAVERPHLFALLGYERDLELFHAMGALVGGNDSAPKIRPCDGAVYIQRYGYASDVYAAGAAAATPENGNAAVIPGIHAQVPSTAITIAVRNYVRLQLQGSQGNNRTG
jgi:hypothetical protein